MTDIADDDLFNFDAETGHAPKENAEHAWHVLIVDDDQDVHQSTCFALANTQILGRPLRFLHAYSASQAVELLNEDTQVA